jgi:hypothetical protein
MNLLGILSICDREYEWMIPWWFYSIRRFSSLPLHIIDIGLSIEMQNWCNRYSIGMTPFSIQKFPIQKEDLNKNLKTAWENDYLGDLWKNRQVWFAKPEALLFSPFQKTLFLDLDCEIVAPIDGLLEKQTPFAICENPYYDQEDYRFNSGVILYEKRDIIHQWALKSYEESEKRMGDENVLSAVLSKTTFPFTCIEEKFNCRPTSKNRENACIIHHVGIEGKRNIMAQILAYKLELSSV